MTRYYVYMVYNSGALYTPPRFINTPYTTGQVLRVLVKRYPNAQSIDIEPIRGSV